MRALLISTFGSRAFDIREKLEPGGSSVLSLTCVMSVDEALEGPAGPRFDLVLLDLDPLGEGGEEALARLCASPRMGPCPVITVSDHEDDARRASVLRAGAQDHLLTSASLEAWQRSVSNSIGRQKFRVALLARSDDAFRFERLDPLTGLLTRQEFEDRTDNALADADPDTKRVAVLLVDLDRFRTVNESLGHRSGDRVLREVASRIQPHLCSGDFAARVGADQFAVLLTGLPNAADATHVAASLRREIGRPHEVQDRQIFLTASIGMAIHPDHGEDATTLLRNADAAVIGAKAFGGNHHSLYAHAMNSSSLHLLSLESDLRKAIQRDELLLHFQPLVNGQDGKIVGAEALARWRHPRLGMVPPVEFIPLAEETGLIEAIGGWVLRSACQHMRAWKRADGSALSISVNVSPRQFWSGDFRGKVERVLREERIPGSRLLLEITESCLLRDVETTMATLRAIRELGVRISIDDFGTGYSSFGALRRLPLDVLKIDQSFVAQVPGDPDSASIASAIIGLSASLGLKTVAEGVETPEQREFLLEHQCTTMQGYYFSAPLPADEFTQLLASGRGLIGAEKRASDGGGGTAIRPPPPQR